jgi:heat shock protein HtpX
MKNTLKTIALLGALSALVLGLGAALAPQYLSLFAVLALAMNLGAYFFSDRIVLAMHRAQELSPAEAPRLHEIVRELAQAAQVPTPRLYLIPEAQPNAFATGRDPAHAVVAVTQGILDLLDLRELRAVLAHEMAHVKNRDILISSVAAALVSLVTWGAHALGWFGLGAHDDEDRGGSLLMAILAPLAATLIQLAISRSREYAADETGARLCGDPEALASALARLHEGVHIVPGESSPATASLFIVSPLAGAGSLLQLFSTHPPVENRIARLMQMGSRRTHRPLHSLFADA